MTNEPRTLINSSANPYEAYPVPELYGEFTHATDLEAIGLALVRKNFQFPETVAITYLWKSHGGASGGRATYGKTVKASGLTGFFAQTDFVIWIAADYVDEVPLSRLQVEALLYHELCHISAEEDGGAVTLALLSHDVEAFRAEIAEYGFWKEDLVAFGRTMQRSLPGFDANNEIPEAPAPQRPLGATLEAAGPELPMLSEDERVTA